MSDYKELLLALAEARARFVIIGRSALVMHGSAYVTNDLDLAYERTRENAACITQALKRFTPRPRGFPDGLPYIFDTQALLSSEILSLDTSAGDLDLLGEIKGMERSSKFSHLLKR